MSETANSTNGKKQATKAALRTGWTTGACAAAAAKAAYARLLTGQFPDPVSITLPRGDTPAFALAYEAVAEGNNPCWAEAAIVKDAGDDPDVTHGALIQTRIERGAEGCGLVFVAGEGVGTVTRAGLPVEVGEPAINPVPRRIIEKALTEVAKAHNQRLDVIATISIAGGAELALKTMNPRLGIIGGLSVLGTTGIVRPFSCASWIASIHRGVDVARAAGLNHVAAATGATSEDCLREQYPQLPEYAYLDMGDFAGGLLKYLRAHPVPKLTVAGGIAKLTKLAQGAMDLHSARSTLDFVWLGKLLSQCDAPLELQELCQNANTMKQLSDMALSCDFPLAAIIAQKAQASALDILRGAPVAVEVIVVDRAGQQLAQVPFAQKAKT